MYGLGEIDLVGVLGAILLNDYVRGNHHREIVHGQLSENLLGDELRLLGVKIEQADRVFKFTKRGFDSPAQVINFLERIGGESIRIQIGNERFIGTVRKLESNNTKRDRVESDKIQIEKIESRFGSKLPLDFGISLDFFCLLFCQNIGHPQVEFL